MANRAQHYWIERGRPERRMPLNSTGEGIVCAYCGIAYLASDPRIDCPRSAAAVQDDLTSYVSAPGGSHD